MKRVIQRTYVDTSVFGGAFDEEFETPSKMFFDLVKEERFRLVISDVVSREIAGAPESVMKLFDEMLPEAEVVRITDDALGLRQAYLDASIVSPRSADDALHVALATANGCAIIVSWNFRHIVHYEKMEQYNAVNTLQGFGRIAIHSPLEIVGHGNQDEDV